jgi:hypothetical protein
LASAVAGSSRDGRGSTRAPEREAWTWMAFHQRPLAMSDVETMVPLPVFSRW